MYVVSGVGGSKLTASKHNTQSNSNAGMPLAATVKAQMLRLLRRSKSTRSAMVIPNKRYSESPAVIVEPYPMALGTTVPAPPSEVRRPRESSSSRHRSHSQARRQSRQVMCLCVGGRGFILFC